MTKSRRASSSSRFQKLSRLWGSRRRRSLRRSRRHCGLRLEPLEDRLLLHGGVSETPDHSLTDHIHADLRIFIDGELVEFPANIGIDETGVISTVHTHAPDHVLHIEPLGGQPLPDFARLGDFFDTWRTNAGSPGNNPDAVLSSTEVLGEQAEGDRRLRMFVNGHRTDEFEDYLINDGDQMVLSLTSNPIVTLNTNQGELLIELFPEETPIHVDNFLNYVNDGDYVDSIFHRSVPEFVVQGGGFETSDVTFDSASQLTPIPTDPPIQNEPGISNTRGTVALAKVGGNPNSGTSQFFVNLNDNSGSEPNGLDFQNGGFTVFGNVLDMSVADRIAALPTVNEGGAFSALPLDEQDQLVVIQSVEGDGKLEGVKFDDIDQDGQQDAGEAGIADVTIFIDSNDNGEFDSGELSTTTDAEGHYEFVLPAGDYTVREILPEGFIQTVPDGAHQVTVEIGRTTSDVDFGNFELSAPTAVDLLAESDTGASDNDNLTRLNNSSEATRLQFEVSGVSAGAVVKLFANDTEIGQATAQGDSVDITSEGSSLLDDGTVTITATQTFSSIVSPASTGLTLEIDTTAPVIDSTAPSEVLVDEELTYDVSTDDEAAGQSPNYSLQDAPAGVDIDADTGVITWTPSSDQRGDHTFSVQATDAAGNASSQTIDIEVIGIDQAAIQLETTDLSGTVTSNFVIGDEFLLNVYVEDTRTVPQGVASALMDIVILNGRVTPLSITYSDAFTEGRSGDILAQELDQLEAGTTVAAGSGRQLMLTARFRSEALGKEVFFSRPPNEITDPDPTPLALFDNGSQEFVPADEIGFGAITIQNVLAFDSTPDEFSVEEDSQGNSLDVLANDDFRTGHSGTLTISKASQGDQNGSVTVAENGQTLIYTPAEDFFGTETFTYEVTDSVTGTTTVDVTVEVQPENDPPTVVDDAFTGEDAINEDSPQQILDVLKNDSFLPDAFETLTITEVGNISDGGDVTIGGSGGHLLYAPAQDFFGTETFTYTVSDGNGGEATGAVTVEILPVNDPPRASNDEAEVEEDSQDNVILVLDNDDGGPNEDDELTIVEVGDPSQEGTVTIAADGKSILYTPRSDFFGTETFTYVIDDGNGAEDEAQVVVTVNNVNDPPTAEDDSFTFTKNTGAHLLDVLDNDMFAPDEGETLTITDVSEGSAGGSVEIKDGGQIIRYEPMTDFTGEETFTYTISDGNGGTATATVDILVRDFIPSSLAGSVFIDANGNDLHDGGESPVAGIEIELTGTDDFGESVDLTTTTDGQGAYQFRDLTPGTYRVTQIQPKALVDGSTIIGSAGGTVESANTIDVTLAEDTTAEDYDFGERGRRPNLISIHEMFASAANFRTTVIVDAQDTTSVVIPNEGWRGFSSANFSLNGDTQLDVDAVEQGTSVQFSIDLTDRGRTQAITLADGSRIYRFVGPEQFRNSSDSAEAEGEHATSTLMSAVDQHMAETENHQIDHVALPDVEEQDDDEQQRFARSLDLLLASQLSSNSDDSDDVPVLW